MNKLVLYFFAVCVLLFSMPLYAQKEGTHWFFGEGQGLSFASGAPVALPKLALTAEEAAVSMSHPLTGEFLFYFEGKTVWSARSNAVMKNGTGMQSGKSSSMGGLAVPFMSNPNKFFLFTVPCLTGDPLLRTDGMFMNIIDMTQDGGKGEVVVKNQLLHAFSAEKITGTLTCDGKGYWIIIHDREQNAFYAYKIYNDVLDPEPVVSFVGQPPGNGHQKITYILGHMKMSPDGSKIIMSDGDRGAELFRFNRKTGQVTDPISLPTPNAPANPTPYPVMYGMSFSPNSKVLYIFGESTRSKIYRLYQYDVSVHRREYIIASQYTTADIAQGDLNLSGLSLAPDQKIYFHTTTGVDRRYLHCISEPDKKGAACNIRYNLLQLSNYNCVGVPNFTDYLFANTTLSMTCNKPSPKFTFFPDTICKGETIRIFDATFNATDWSWYFPKGNPERFYEKVPPPIRYMEAGVYEIRLTTYNSNGDSVYKDTVVVLDAPLADAGRDIRTCDSVAIIGTPPQAGLTYSWTPVQGLSNPKDAMPRVRVGSAVQRYIVSVKNSRGCLSYDTVFVGPLQGSLPDSKLTLCVGDTTSLRINATGTVLWSPVKGLSSPTSFNPLIFPNETTRYTVIVTNGLCKDTAIVQVTVNSLPVADAGPDRSVCGNSTFIGTTGIPNHIYAWSPKQGLDDSTLARPLVTTTVPMTYILTVKSPEGCIDKDTVNITVTGVTAKVSADTIICKGGIAQLYASGGEQYDWSPSHSLSSDFDPKPTAFPDTTTTYRVIVISGFCRDTAYTTVRVQSPPKADAGKDIYLCGNEGIIGTPGSNSVRYQWQPITGLSNPTIAMPSVSVQTTTTYILTVTDSLGCYAVDSVLVDIGTLKISVSNDTTVCIGGSARLTASGALTYQWSPSAGLDNPQSATPQATPTQTTQYRVIAQSGNCIDTGYVTVNVIPLPIADAGNDRQVCEGMSVQLGSAPQSDYTYQWKNVAGTMLGTQSFLNVDKAQSDTYIVMAFNRLGCDDSDTVEVIAIPYPNITVSDDISICPGDSVLLSASGAKNYRWQWDDNPQVQGEKLWVKPQKNTIYTVIGANELSCSDTASVNVTIKTGGQRTIALNTTASQDSTYTIGSTIPLRITVPTGLDGFTFRMRSEQETFVASSAITHTLGNTWNITAQNSGQGIFTLIGKGTDTLGGTIDISYAMYLPRNWSDTKTFTLSLENASSPTGCIGFAGAAETFIRLSKYCASDLRGVQSVGTFSLSTDGKSGVIHSGFGGNMTLAIYDMAGNVVWSKKEYYPHSTEIHIDIPPLSGGIYIARIINGMFKRDAIFTVGW